MACSSHLLIVTVTFLALGLQISHGNYAYVINPNGVSYATYYGSFPYRYPYQQVQYPVVYSVRNALSAPSYASTSNYHQFYTYRYPFTQFGLQSKNIQKPVQRPLIFQGRKFERLQAKPVQVPEQALVQARPVVPVKPAEITSIRPIPSQKPKEEEKDQVLDFSSGSAQSVENNAKDGFSIFKGLFTRLGLDKEFENIGNITIFSPENKAFDKLDFDIKDIDDATLRRWMLKHFVKGTLRKKDIPEGELLTIGGEYVRITKDDKNRMRVFSNSGEAKAKVTNIATK